LIGKRSDVASPNVGGPTRDSWSLKSDLDVITAIAEQNQEAFEQLVHRYAEWLGLVVLRLGGNVLGPSDIEEAVADTFVAAWALAKSYSAARGSARAWLMQLARFRVLEARRKRWRARRETTLDPSAAADLADTLSDPAQDAVRQLTAQEWGPKSMAELSSLDQQIIWRRVVEEQSPTEIAVALYLTPNVVRVRLFRSLRKLRQVLERSSS
jgi:RNA polymerase sigma factor (sigma-70 family)